MDIDKRTAEKPMIYVVLVEVLNDDNLCDEYMKSMTAFSSKDAAIEWMKEQKRLMLEQLGQDEEIEEYATYYDCCENDDDDGYFATIIKKWTLFELPVDENKDSICSIDEK